MRKSVGLVGAVFVLAACHGGESGTSAGDAAVEATSNASALSVLRAQPALRQLLSTHRARVTADGTFEHEARPAWAAHATLPARADGAVRVARLDRSLAVTPLDVAHVVGHAEDEGVVYEHATASTDVVLVPRVDGFEELRVLHDARASRTFRWRVQASEGLSLRVRNGYVEAFDAGGRVHLVASPMYAVDAHAARRSLAAKLEGDVLVATLDDAGLAYPITVDPLWSSTPSAPASGAANFSVQLSDGRLFTAMPNGPAGAYIYDPSTNAWSSPYFYPSGWVASGTGAALLSDGSVLVVDGSSAQSARFVPSSGTFVATTGNPTYSCGSCAMARASDGRVVKVPNGSPTAEVYNPSTKTWSAAALPTTNVSNPAMAITMKDGRVLTLTSVGQTPIIWSPSSSAWTYGTSGSRLSGARGAVLGDGRIVFTGQIGTSGVPPLGTQIYNPTTSTWSNSLPVGRVRYEPALVTLPNGRVLAAGGYDPVSSVDYYPDAEIFDPTYNSWTLIDSMPEPHAKPAFAGFADGSVLVAAGLGNFGSPTGAATRYYPLANGASCAGPVAVACAAQYCVDGVCCTSASCPNGTCAAGAGPGRGAGSCALNLGQACGKDGDCASNHCADGVCCNTGCTGQCEACNQLGTKGTCTPVLGAPVAPRAACGGAGAGTTCGASCNGSDTTKCNFASAGTVACGTDSCTSGVETKAGTCNGAGTCSTTTNACGAYACGAELCKRSCVTDVDCADGYYCGGDKCLPKVGLGSACSSGAMCPSGLSCTDGVCCGVASCGDGSACNLDGSKGTCKKVLGTTCTNGTECGSGFCADGVCCNRACDAQCEACDVPASKGTCSPVSGTPHGTRPACGDGGGDACKALECDGAKDPTACTAYKNGGTVVCKTASCDGSNLVPQSTCDGAGSCVAPPTASCGRYACDAARLACKTSCTTNDDCATGFSCVAGTCAEGARCSDDKLTSTSTDGKSQACSPYLCTSAGTCGNQCTKSEDCAPGFICDGAACVPAPSGSDSSSGGCAYGASSMGAGSLFGLALLGLAAARRRR